MKPVVRKAQNEKSANETGRFEKPDNRNYQVDQTERTGVKANRPLPKHHGCESQKTGEDVTDIVQRIDIESPRQ